MSYAKSIFFIPVWFDQFKPFTKAMAEHPLWEPTDPKKAWAGYLFRYASEINKNKDLFASYTLKDNKDKITEAHCVEIYLALVNAQNPSKHVSDSTCTVCNK